MKFTDALRRELANQLEQFAGVAETEARAIVHDALDQIEITIERFGDSPNAEEMIAASVDGSFARAARRGYILSQEARAASFRVIVGAIRVIRVVLIGG